VLNKICPDNLRDILMLDSFAVTIICFNAIAMFAFPFIFFLVAIQYERFMFVGHLVISIIQLSLIIPEIANYI